MVATHWILGQLLAVTSVATTPVFLDSAPSASAASQPAADPSGGPTDDVGELAQSHDQAAEEEPAAAEAEATKTSDDGRRYGRNALVLGTHAKIPDWALSLTYQRVLGRRFSVGAGIEYGFQANGYWHLQGVGETLSGQVWLGKPFNGVFAEGSVTLAHQFLVRQPRLSTTAVVPGIGLGFRWTHRSGLTVGASGGLRWGAVVDDSELVCTRPKYCTSVREGAYARITADLGFVF